MSPPTSSAPHREPPRLVRERRTLGAMIGIFCRDHHGTGRALCPDCATLHTYAMSRLDHCPFGEDKPTCAHCPIHCYKPEMRDKVRAVMRYSGPRMLWRHPLLALRHLWDDRKPAEKKPH